MRISTLLDLRDGMTVDEVEGRVVYIGEFRNGTGEHGPWSFQTIEIEGDSKIQLKFKNCGADLAPLLSNGSTIHLEPYNSDKHGLVGLKTHTETYTSKKTGEPVSRKQIIVTKTAQVTINGRRIRLGGPIVTNDTAHGGVADFPGQHKPTMHAGSVTMGAASFDNLARHCAALSAACYPGSVDAAVRAFAAILPAAVAAGVVVEAAPDASRVCSTQERPAGGGPRDDRDYDAADIDDGDIPF